MRKRRALWILGVTACLFAGFAATASWISQNSPDAKIERTVAQIIEEYGFEINPDAPALANMHKDGSVEHRYESQAVSQLEIDQIDKRIREACSGCTAHEPRSLSMGLVGGPASYLYDAGDEHRTVVSVNLIGGTTWPKWFGLDLNEKRRAHIVIRRRNPTGFWAKVTSWFPL